MRTLSRDDHDRPTRRSWARALGGSLLASVLVGSLLTVGSAPAQAVSQACQEESDKMPAPWKYTHDYTRASPPNRFAKAPMYVPPYPKAEDAAVAAAKAGDQAKANRLRKIAAQPRATWFADGSMDLTNLKHWVAGVVADARQHGEVATLVMYGLPLRDCGGYSQGGATSAKGYRDWVQAFKAGLISGGVADGPGVSVIIEPDALALLGNLPAERQRERIDLIRYATYQMAWTPKTSAYIDAGTRGWVSAKVMTERLSKAGIGMARGFSLNVANFNTHSGEVSYGQQMVGLLGWKSFVIDTGRNGNGPNGQFCNPPGRALGQVPKASPQARIDAYLWVKPPGESDGDCNEGDPAAGEFFPSYANELAKNAGWYVTTDVQRIPRDELITSIKKSIR